MKSDIKKLIIFGLASITLMGLAGCNQDRDSNAYGAPKTSTVSSTESLTETVTEQMTEEKSDITTEARYADVEEFMEYYNISEDEIPKDYIQDFIWIYSIGPDFKENQTDAGDTGHRMRNRPRRDGGRSVSRPVYRELRGDPVRLGRGVSRSDKDESREAGR